MTLAQKVLINTGILFGYVIFTWLVLQVHADYSCLISLVCTSEYPGQDWYVLPGRLLAFLNLWALIFYVNLGGFRDGPFDLDEMVLPAIISLIWTAIVFVAAIWIMSIGGLLIMGYFGIDLS
jgi:hypothetical protein